MIKVDPIIDSISVDKSMTIFDRITVGESQKSVIDRSMTVLARITVGELQKKCH